MAGNSGIPSKQMKIWIANKRAQIKKQIIREENARLRLENEMLTEENREMSLMQRKKVCGLCVLKAENARLRAEFERLQVIAAMRKNIANPKEELGLPRQHSRLQQLVVQLGPSQTQEHMCAKMNRHPSRPWS